MERVNLTLPKNYKARFEEYSKKRELPLSEILRRWIDEKIPAEE